MATAAFLTRDSYLGETGRPLTLNRYGYCLGNPVYYVDPSGHITLDELSHVLDMTGESYDFFMKGAAAIVRDGMILSETLLVPVDWVAHASGGNVHGFTESVAHVRQREEEWIADVAEKAQDMSAFYVGTCAGDALTLYILWGSMRNPSDMNGGGSYAQKAYVQTAEGIVVEVEVESNGTVVGVLSGVPSTDVSGTIRNMEKEHEKTSDVGTRDGSIKNGGKPKGEYDSQKNKIPDNNSTTGHIFRDAEGHISDTPENRTLLEDVANDPVNFRGIDKYGNVWHTRIQSDGGQVWVESRNGNIFDGGINITPKQWNLETGLKKP